MTNEELELSVAAELLWDPKVDSDSVAVAAHDGTVTLRGTVGSFREKREAQKAAQRVHGVVFVNNELDVRLLDERRREDADLRGDVVGRWGMSQAVGPMAVLPPAGQESPLGLDGVGPATRELVDREARRIVEECYGEAEATLTEHCEQLDALARTLLDRETLDEDEAYEAAGISRDTAPGARARGEVPDTAPAPGMPPRADNVAAPAASAG